MKTMAFAFVVMLTLVPFVSAEETFNPDTGEWEYVPEMDAYNPHENGWNHRQLQDEAWSDDVGDGWGHQQTEDEWAGSNEDELEREPSDNDGYPNAEEEQWHHEETVRNESWSHPAETEDAGPPPWVGIPPHNLPDSR
jgi:hypothetical protein